MGLDNQGQILWKKKYGNSKFEYLNNSFISRSYYKQGNDLYYAGSALDSNNIYLGVLIKFNFNGDTVWQKRFYDSNDYVYPQLVNSSVDNGFLITGIFEDPNNVGRRAMLIKTDANGNELWRRKINKSNPDVEDGKNIIQDSATKNIIIAGYQYIGGSQSYCNVVILDSLGMLPQRYNYMSSGGGILLDMIQTKDKKIVIAGLNYANQTLFGNDPLKSFILQFDLNAPQLPIWKIDNFDRWSVTNGFNCITESANGDLLVAGILDTMLQHNLPPNALTRITKINPAGVILSNNYYNYKINAPIKDNNLIPKSIEKTSDGGWVLSLYSVNAPSPNPFFFVKYDSTGCDSSLAYCQSIMSTVSINENKWYNRSRIAVYPNPANNLLNISVAGEDIDGELFLVVNDLSGREVKRVKLSSVNGICEASIQDLTNGVYLLSVLNKETVLYKSKLIKQD